MGCSSEAVGPNISKLLAALTHCAAWGTPPIRQSFQHNTQPPGSQSSQNINRRHYFPLSRSAENHSPTNFPMLRKSSTIMAADLHQRKSKAKVIDWVPRQYSWGVRDVPVEVGATASQLRPRKRAIRWPRAQNNDTLQGETAPQPMDIDETFWAEEPVMPTNQKRVCQPACLSLVNLTYLPVSACIHWRIHPQDWPLFTLPSQFWGCPDSNHLSELQVFSIWVEVFRLLFCTCTLQGVLPKVIPATSFSQSSTMGWKLFYAIVVAGGRGVLAIWALWGPMSKSNCTP